MVTAIRILRAVASVTLVAVSVAALQPGKALAQAPGVDITGTEDDFSWLGRAIQEGRYALAHPVDGLVQAPEDAAHGRGI